MSTVESERPERRENRIPEKSSYTLGEVCEYAGTQPYVVRFWEGEFPALRPERQRGAPALYSRRDLELVLRIKALLDGEERTISDARRLLAEEPDAANAAAATAVRAPRRAAPPPAVHEAPVAAPLAPRDAGEERVLRERYEGALEEIQHLRLELSEAVTQRRKAELAAREAREREAAVAAGAERARTILEALLARLEGTPRSDA